MSVHWKLLSISGHCLVDLHFETLPLLAVSFVSACLLFQMLLFFPLYLLLIYLQAFELSGFIELEFGVADSVSLV